jgi:hypothetical protein
VQPPVQSLARYPGSPSGVEPASRRRWGAVAVTRPPPSGTEDARNGARVRPAPVGVRVWRGRLLPLHGPGAGAARTERGPGHRGVPRAAGAGLPGGPPPAGERRSPAGGLRRSCGGPSSTRTAPVSPPTSGRSPWRSRSVCDSRSRVSGSSDRMHRSRKPSNSPNSSSEGVCISAISVGQVASVISPVAATLHWTRATRQLVAVPPQPLAG